MTSLWLDRTVTHVDRSSSRAPRRPRGRRGPDRPDHRPAARASRSAGRRRRGAPRRRRDDRQHHRQAVPAARHQAVADAAAPVPRRSSRRTSRPTCEGQQWLLRFCSDHDVPVQTRDAITYAAAESEIDAARDEHDAAQIVGLDVRWVDPLDVPFPFHGGTLLPDQAQFDPMDVLDALVAELRSTAARCTRAAGSWASPSTGAPSDARRRIDASRRRTSSWRPARRSSTAGCTSRRSSRCAPTPWPSTRPDVPDGDVPVGRLARRARSATLPARTGRRLLVGGNGHPVGRTGLRARAPRRPPGVDRAALPRRRRDARLVGPGLPVARRHPVRRSPAARRWAHPPRDRLRQVGHDERGRCGPQHHRADPRREAVLGRAARPARHPSGAAPSTSCERTPASASQRCARSSLDVRPARHAETPAEGEGVVGRVRRRARPPSRRSTDGRARSPASAPTWAACCRGTTPRSRGTARCTDRASPPTAAVLEGPATKPLAQRDG